MQDLPDSGDIVEAVAGFLRKEVLPCLEGRTAFHALVAANMLEIVVRELKTAPEENHRELKRLGKLLHTKGTLKELNALLCEKIMSGNFSLETPGLQEHLWLTTLTKLSIDQPKYAAYAKALKSRPAETSGQVS